MKTDQSPVELKRKDKRIIGTCDGTRNGPTVVVLGGIHGNEPAGVKAIKNVFQVLEKVKADTTGTFIGLRANLNALERGVRYIDEDMNRIWFPSILDHIRSSPETELDSSERAEIKTILELLDRVLPDPSESPGIIIDLHSFSAEGSMFAITAPKAAHVQLIEQLYLPMIFGIEDTLRGTALRYYQDRGHIAFALEGGQHNNELTIFNKTAALLLLLAECGFIQKQQIPGIQKYEEHLKSQTRTLPSKVHLVYQHMIEQGDRFRMRPGFRNFQPVKKGEWLANDREGKIQAECDGFILMPLYQNQGNDGFFIVREQDSG